MHRCRDKAKLQPARINSIYLQTDEARVLALRLLQNGAGLLPHVGALLHSHEQHVSLIALLLHSMGRGTGAVGVLDRIASC